METHTHFTEEGRIAAVAVVLILQARAKTGEERINRPEDSIVSEMTKQPLQGKCLRLQDASRIASWVWKKLPILGDSKISVLAQARCQAQTTVSDVGMRPE